MAGSLADRFGRRPLLDRHRLVRHLLVPLRHHANTLFLNLSAPRRASGRRSCSRPRSPSGRRHVRGRDHGVAFGIFDRSPGVAVAIGPVLGGAITSGISWRWIFFVNLRVGVLALGATIWGVNESRDPAARARLRRFRHVQRRPRRPRLGLILSISDGWGSGVVEGSLIAAVVLLVSFVLIEQRTAEPMLSTSGCCGCPRSMAV